MNWWTWIWIGLVASLTIGGAWDDHRDKRRVLAICLGLASGGACIVSVLAFSLKDVAAAIGRWLVPLSLLAGLQIGAEVVRDIRILPPDPDLSPRENRSIKILGVVAVAIIFGAAVVVGVWTGGRHW